MPVDLLDQARWECCWSAPGAITHPDELDRHGVAWIPAAVPGTAAAALRDAGREAMAPQDYDALDWWFRCHFAVERGVPRGLFVLELDGIATIADVWLNGRHWHHGENMFRSTKLEVTPLPGANELVIRCGALTSVLGRPRPRPRWKTYMVTHQNLRWIRTSLLGRIPGWAVTPPVVGPWRAVRLRALGARDRLTGALTLEAQCQGRDGAVVEVMLELWGAPVEQLTLAVQGQRAAFELEAIGPWRTRGSARLAVRDVDRWWPHTHGPQPLYEVLALTDDGAPLSLGRVGFRTVEVNRASGGFEIVVNGEPIFCRGACWLPPDPVGMVPRRPARRRLLELAKAANMNMLRVAATGVYEDRTFFEHCDELGILVWQDCMFAFVDPPEDEDFVSEVEAELTEVFATASGHPSLAVVCGNQEVEEIAAMNGLPPSSWRSELFDKTIPALVESELPGVAYLSSNPTGGALPLQMDVGVSQYFGVGGYLRPIDDARRAGVRFAAECLAFATPPEPATVEEACGGAWRAGHDPAWKQAVHHDAGRSWDMEDVREHYQRLLFGGDPFMERYRDPERALELGRATNAELMGAVFSEWRRPGSLCAGGLVLALADLRPGAGWGLIDALGRPKAPWYVLRRVFRPLGLLVTDEGLNGLRLHVVNDTAEPFTGVLRLDLYARGEVHVEGATRSVTVGPRRSLVVESVGMLEGFRDLTYAYRFGPCAHDVVAASLLCPDGTVVAEAVYLPGGQSRSVEDDLGLHAWFLPPRGKAEPDWRVEVTTRRFAQWVALDVPGYVPEDSWFHMLPGSRRVIRLEAEGTTRPPRGRLRALNSGSPVLIGAPR